MEVEVIQTNQVSVVAPGGNLDPASAAEVRHTLKALLNRGMTRFVLDLCHVRYVDRAVWGELAPAGTRAREAGGEVRVCGLGADLLTIFSLIRLSPLMPVYPTRERATAFSQEQSSGPGSSG